ncbi:Gfo/Idh/MocA family oxidoreductase [Antarcticibacterium flavum]|uniref:Gfo/Idh/MocA family oxidoreductase n=1 Tax=Antarcticibacterium flavum TaxID=2058175 RepID=A0A5B7X4B8_9FLAO|nr:MULTISPECIES: Gfo/Idh/MocA family oxidoreductase [Antarcticibacterium]MCM4159149.1 oxidoreductase [Antarcticibacterium sp. W02-3]QCY69548.1 Gfo/Idh/MocA family oxidoreductase [Antarcticibacterium flavum]
MKKKIAICSFLILIPLLAHSQERPVRIGIAGLTHTHVHWLLGREDLGDVEIAGIAEPNRELAQRYAKQHGFSMDLVYNSLEEMIAATKPEAVVAFGTIFQHLEVVEACAPKGIHVMVEKPLAVNMEHALRMQSLAKEHNIHLLTNYETTWYPTNQEAKKLLDEGTVGDLHKIIVRDGHRGPKKIGVNEEFLEWLTDPVQNGGGALMDFGCYGANLATWIQEGKKPLRVTAVTRQLQPENNPLVEDEANIILDYEDATVLIQASWNWPIGRKDMELYGLTGVIYSDNRNDLRVRQAEGYDNYSEEAHKLQELSYPYNDPFAYFAAVIRGQIIPAENDLSSLENNMTVMEILDAARRSAEKGKTVNLNP